MKPGRALLLAFLLLGLCACSATKLVYNRLDWFAAWEAGKYADLSAGQEKIFSQGFSSLWSWHRSTELPAYAKDLRELAALSAEPIDAARASSILETYSAWWKRSLERLSPQLCTVLATFDAAQVESTLEQVDDEIAEDAGEYDLSEPRLRRKSKERVEKNLRRWLGPLTPEQRALIETWSARRGLTYDLWLDNRRSWRTRFAAVLEERQGPEFCQRLDELLLRSDAAWSEDARRRLDASRGEWIELAVEMSRLLTPKQRAHFAKELEALAGELEGLSQKAA